MKRTLLALTVAALMAMMVAAGPASAQNISSGGSGGITEDIGTSLAVTQENGVFSVDSGDDDIDFDDFGIFDIFEDDGIDLDNGSDLESGSVNIGFGVD